MQTKLNWNCGLTRLMDALSGKWTLQIFWNISKKNRQGLIPDDSFIL